MKRIDLIKGFLLLAFSLVCCHQSMRLPLWSGRKPGPGLFPLFLGISLGFLSLLFIVVKGLGKNRETPPLWADQKDKKRIFLTLGVLIAYAIVLPYLGFLITSFFLIFFLIALSYSQKWLVVGIVSFFMSLAFYAIFQILLKIQLPHGILGI